MAEAQWMERQRTRSFRRLSECASLRAAHSAQMMMMTMMMGALDFFFFSHTDSLTRLPYSGWLKKKKN